MTSTPIPPLWRGRVLALAGILLLAFNLRSAVAALSPIVGEISRDIPLGGFGLGLLGMLPQLCFAVFGLATPRIVRGARDELVLVVALLVMLAGHVLRALAPDFVLLAVGSGLAFAGMAVGNVMLPPVVKRYFPDRIALLTSLYAIMLSVSTILPPLVAVPVADGAGWRLALGMWGGAAVLALIPWTALLLRGGRPPSVSPSPSVAAEPEPHAPARRVTGVWRAPLSWALAGLFAVSSLNAYALFAWLPEMLDERAGTSPTAAGVMLSIYGGVGLPASIVVPWLAARLRSIAPILLASLLFFLVGDLGLLLWPATATWLWVTLAGLGPLLFPLMLVQINRRTRTHEGAVALSGFVQGVGYVFGSLGPLVFGLLHDLTGDWLWPMVFLIATALTIFVTGPIGSRRVYLEDLLAAPTAGPAGAAAARS